MFLASMSSAAADDCNALVGKTFILAAGAPPLDFTDGPIRKR